MVVFKENFFNNALNVGDHEALITMAGVTVVYSLCVLRMYGGTIAGFHSLWGVVMAVWCS